MGEEGDTAARVRVKQEEAAGKGLQRHPDAEEPQGRNLADEDDPKKDQVRAIEAVAEHVHVDTGTVSSQNQTSTFATISPIVTKGAVRRDVVAEREHRLLPRFSDRRECLADAVADSGQLERLARDLAQQLVGGRLLALGPELAQE